MLLNRISNILKPDQRLIPEYFGNQRAQKPTLITTTISVDIAFTIQANYQPAGYDHNPARHLSLPHKDYVALPPT